MHTIHTYFPLIQKSDIFQQEDNNIYWQYLSKDKNKETVFVTYLKGFMEWKDCILFSIKVCVDL